MKLYQTSIKMCEILTIRVLFTQIKKTESKDIHVLPRVLATFYRRSRFTVR